MRRHVFLRIFKRVSNNDEYFQLRNDAIGRISLSSLHKCVVAIHMLAYGSLTDSTNKYVRIGETTTMECLQKFVQGVNEVFGIEYLRRPHNNDIERLLKIGDACGFPVMLGSIGCMHWEWKNCPTTWKDQYQRGDREKATIMLEAVTSHDLWIWHAHFGIVDSNNDINVLNQSDVLK